MPEEIKNEEANEINETNIDEKLNEILNDPSIKTEEEKTFLKNVSESLKKGEIPLDLILSKSNEAIFKLNEISNNHPEFESFVKHYQNKINDAMSQMTEMLKKESNGK